MKKRFYKKSIFFRLFSLSISLILTCSFCINVSVGIISRNILKENVIQSNKHLLVQIDHNLTNLYNELISIINVSDSSSYMKNLLSGPTPNQLAEFKVKMGLHEYLSGFKSITDYFKVWITVFSNNGVVYTTGDATFTASIDDLMEETWYQERTLNQDRTSYTLSHKGLNSSTENKNVIIYARALINDYTQKSYGTLFLEFDPCMLSLFYEGSYEEGEIILITDRNGTIISSNYHQYIDTILSGFTNITSTNESNNTYYFDQDISYTYISMPVKAFDGYMIKFVPNSHINNSLKGLNYTITLITFLFTILAIFVSFGVCKRISMPINQLSKRMSSTKYATTSEILSIQSKNEIEILESTYNNMLKEIEMYIHNLMQENECKRLAELNALQMQINPHFLYNTLGSIKYLVIANENRDVTKISNAISSLISLLKLTISNTKEMINLLDEIENLKAYFNIQNLRYDDGITWDIICFEEELYRCKVPKLILQPIVENAIFHGFNQSNGKGHIKIYISSNSSNLKIEIIDNGIGMDKETTLGLLASTNGCKKENSFSGIGLNNINDRIKLLFGNEYGLNIMSYLNKGTTVKIILPKQNV